MEGPRRRPRRRSPPPSPATPPIPRRRLLPGPSVRGCRRSRHRIPPLPFVALLVAPAVHAQAVGGNRWCPSRSAAFLGAVGRGGTTTITTRRFLATSTDGEPPPFSWIPAPPHRRGGLPWYFHAEEEVEGRADDGNVTVGGGGIVDVVLPPEPMKAEPPTLPFECTECGKCCRTVGSVYMSPEEVEAASGLLGIPPSEFRDLYVSEEEVMPTAKAATSGATSDRDGGEASVDEIGWVKLASKPVVYDGGDGELGGVGACVFLNETNNHCTIYEARPVQCSTYPFWPRILGSADSWNDEVRLVGDPPSSSHDVEGDGRYWTPEGGGCEGMRRVRVGGVTTSDTATATSIASDRSSGRLAGDGPNAAAKTNVRGYEEGRAGPRRMGTTPATAARNQLELHRRHEGAFGARGRRFRPVKNAKRTLGG